MVPISVLFINCTLKPSPQKSNTQALIDKVAGIYQNEGIKTETIRLTDYNIKPGNCTYLDKDDEWPSILQKIKACDICVIATPIWMGYAASTVQRVFERLDAMYYEDELSDEKTGQFFTYNKVAGALVTGNEDGAHEAVRHILWAMQEYGFTIPPNANSYWVGMAGGNKNYADGEGGKHMYTNKNNLYMAYNTIFMARLLKENPITTSLKELDKIAKEVSK